MAELITLARPYARAAFEHALAGNALQGWSDGLSTAAAVTAQPRVAALLAAPGSTSVQKADAVIAICGEALPADVRNFVRVLAENKRLPLLPQVHELFMALKALQEQTVEIDVASAYAIAPEQIEKLAGAMSSKLKRSVRVSTTVDESLIGGVVIRTDDLVIDGSVRGRLARLHEAMNS